MATQFPYQISNKYGKVNVYETKNGPYISYKIVWKTGKKRNRESRSSAIEAIGRAEEVLADLSACAATRPNSSSTQWVYYQQCEQMLNGTPLIEAVKFYLRHHRAATPGVTTVWDAAKAFIESRRAAGKSERYVKSLAYDLQLAEPLFDYPIATVTPAQLDELLATIPHPRTRRNRRTSLVVCWKWAKTKGWLPYDIPTAAERTDTPAVVAKDPGVLTPVELEDVLRKLKHSPHHHKLIPYVVIGAFAGVRSAEICRMRWETNVKLDEGLLVLGSDITKTSRRRVIRMEPELVNWLRTYRGEGKVVPVYKPQDALTRLRKTKWPHNALRHSAVSYLMARHQNAAVIAEQCGHTESVMQVNYKAVVTPEQGERWFAIAPKPLDTPT